jgi:release factor glutamine methyltransferase
MLRMAREFLERKGVEEARLDAELLVGHALGLDRLQLYCELDRPITEAELSRARELLVRRGRHEPTAYVTGKREFYGRDFVVRSGVLIPRPETELIVDRAREIGAKSSGEIALADLGTGSGCLAVTLALELTDARVWATDISEEAVEVARENAQLLEAEVDFRVADGVAGLREVVTERGAPLDMIVSNPPYVEPGEAASLAPEVRDYEPDGALFAPSGDPDHWVRALLEEGRDILAKDGILLVELGHLQGPRVLALAEELGWSASLHKDLEGVSRVFEASWLEA